MGSSMKSYEKEPWEDVPPPKVKAMYEAVLDLFASGRELGTLKVEEITKKAGIGKGTAYEYFSTKEEIVVGALNYEAKRYMETLFQIFEQEKSFREVVMQALLIMEQASDTYHGFMLMQRIVSDRELTGKGILDELKKHKDSCQCAIKLRDSFVKLALEEESITQTNHYKIESAILSQFTAYGFYLTHKNLFSETEQAKAREFAYESIVKILNQDLTFRVTAFNIDLYFDKGSEKEEYTTTLERENGSSAERPFKAGVVEGSF